MLNIDVEWKFKQAFNIFLRSQQCLNAPDIWFNNCVERMFKQMLKPFKRALTLANTWNSK